MKLSFSDKTIIGTILYLVLYQMVICILFLKYPNLFEIMWINQLIFATSTSLGAVFWSLYVVRKYEKFANFENLVTKIYGDIERFQEKLVKFSNLLDHPLLGSILNGDDQDDEPDMDELKNKYLNQKEK